ncbi:MAG: hypothetical protein IPG74_01470 [Flavobacteriales bacterium]|nr:hypothetical protein [Flavobacteriales bacterium]
MDKRIGRFIVQFLLCALLCGGCATNRMYKEGLGCEFHYLIRSISYTAPEEAGYGCDPALGRAAEAADWNKAQRMNTRMNYDSFIARYPESTHVPEAFERIEKLKEDAAWYEARQKNTTAAYEQFLATQRYSNSTTMARDAIEALKHEAIWSQVEQSGSISVLEKFIAAESEQKNTVLAYQAYLEMMPDGAYVDEANGHIEAMLWDQAVRSNTIKAYQAYLDQAPWVRHRDEAEKKLIDLEVDAIFKGEHGQLPPMSRAGSGYSTATTSDVKIFNNTGYTLTVRYSGKESQRIILQPKQRSSVELPNGNYRITASVNAANVSNYAGSEALGGGNTNRSITS